MTEQEYKRQVYDEADQVKTVEELNLLIERLTAHPHDYGTIIYACAAAMIGAYKVMNASPQGGITGFQAGCLMWEMVHRFGEFSGGPLRIQDFDHLRFPQYDDDWAVWLSPEGRAQIVERANRALSEARSMAPGVRKRHEEIVAGSWPSFVVLGEDG